MLEAIPHVAVRVAMTKCPRTSNGIWIVRSKVLQGVFQFDMFDSAI
jgi:hypothetical protein